MTVRIIQGDCRESMRSLIADGVKARTCVTSPPYWGLRDYGTAQWVGGDPLCQHSGTVARTAPPGTAKQSSNRGANAVMSGNCACGATRIDSQLGLEPTPDEYVANMVEVFRGVRDVLTDDGTLWLNLGDCYAGTGGQSPQSGDLFKGRARQRDNVCLSLRGKGDGLKAKDLVGIPWAVAFALRADGWYLRQDIIWAKPNPMPESVTDRCTKAHEYIFLLTKSARYYYDAPSISDPVAAATVVRARATNTGAERKDGGVADNQCGLTPEQQDRYYADINESSTRNKRSIWTVSTKPFTGAHFATFPPDLIEPCILAGCPPGGVVLDPFGGAGTTGLVADRHGRDAILIELNPEYADMARARIKGDSPLFAEVRS